MFYVEAIIIGLIAFLILGPKDFVKSVVFCASLWKHFSGFLERGREKWTHLLEGGGQDPALTADIFEEEEHWEGHAASSIAFNSAAVSDFSGNGTPLAKGASGVPSFADSPYGSRDQFYQSIPHSIWDGQEGVKGCEALQGGAGTAVQRQVSRGQTSFDYKISNNISGAYSLNSWDSEAGGNCTFKDRGEISAMPLGRFSSISAGFPGGVAAHAETFASLSDCALSKGRPLDDSRPCAEGENLLQHGVFSAFPSMSELFWSHLKELRKRIGWCLGAFAFLFCVCYWQAQHILSFLARPLIAQLVPHSGRRFLYTHLSEAFSAYLGGACFGALILVFPFWVWHLWRFTRPALRGKERHIALLLFFGAPALFAAGVLLAYGVICPWAWSFFLGFDQTTIGGIPLCFEAKIVDYLALSIKLMSLFGLGFQLPVALIFLHFLGILSLGALRKGRRYAFLIITLVSALVTPPDFFSPLGLILPLCGLYEVAILYSAWAQSGKSFFQHFVLFLTNRTKEKNIP